MSDVIKNTIIFIAGAAVGSFVTYRLVNDKFQKIADEEIESVREVYRNKQKQDKVVEEKTTDEPEINEPIKLNNKEYTKYVKTVQNLGYVSEDEEPEQDEEESEMELLERPPIPENPEGPYIIPPEEFGVCQGYELITLTHYNDGVLADDMDEVMEDTDNSVPSHYADHFGEYEEDVVYVRNDRLRVDFEIVRDLRDFQDVVWRPPHML